MSLWKRITEMSRYFSDGNGFSVLVILCVAIITGTAVWANTDPRAYVAPTPPAADEQIASVLMQQSLRNQATPSPLPQEQIAWTAPLDENVVITGFSSQEMIQSGVTFVWSLHQAVDLAADYGDPVYSVADGTIVECGIDPINGTYVEIRHAAGHMSRYEGLAALSGIKARDRIHAGQTIGFVGNGRLDESDRGPHLHLSITKDGIPIDPMAYIEE